MMRENLSTSKKKREENVGIVIHSSVEHGGPLRKGVPFLSFSLSPFVLPFTALSNELGWA